MCMLKLLNRDRPLLRVGEVSRELRIQKSTVSRLLRVMSDHGWLEREADGLGYMVGRNALVFADLYLSGTPR